MNQLQVHLSRLIVYAESADVKLQREVILFVVEYFMHFLLLIVSLMMFLLCSCCVFFFLNRGTKVAEKLANEAVKPARQVQIVEYGGLKLLVPLTRSTDIEVQRLAAHALANLSVNGTVRTISYIKLRYL